MHDPMTVAHEMKYPWFHYKPWPKKFRRDPNPFELRHNWERMSKEEQSVCCRHWPEGYRNSFITIWHVDPEKDGSDDSCGYSYPKITKKQREILRNAARWEGRDHHFLNCPEKHFTGTVEQAECLYRGLVLLVVRVLRLKLSWDEICRYSAEAIHIRTGEKFGGVFCFLPGYHTNCKEDKESERVDHFHGILCNVARGLLDLKRPWYRHPRWHIWHWKLQIHPLQTFKRWAFSRCCKCGKGFKWGASVTSNQWDSDGPSWFGEKHVMHDSCSGIHGPCEVKSSEPQTVSSSLPASKP
jgi:hypothetical protein